MCGNNEACMTNFGISLAPTFKSSLFAMTACSDSLDSSKITQKQHHKNKNSNNHPEQRVEGKK